MKTEYPEPPVRGAPLPLPPPAYAASPPTPTPTPQPDVFGQQTIVGGRAVISFPGYSVINNLQVRKPSEVRVNKPYSNCDDGG